MTRPWLQHEIEVLRQYPAKPMHRVAPLIPGRSLGACYQRAAILGLRTQPRFEYGAEFEKFLREKNAEGWSDAEIAADWCGARQTVGSIRRRLGLPCNAYNARHVAKVKAATARQCVENDVANLNQLQATVNRTRAHEAGWPPDCTPMMCDVLNALESGPKTRREICEARGKRYHHSKALTASRGRSVMVLLVEMGFVVRLTKRVRFGKGQGKTAYQFALAPGFTRRRNVTLRRAELEAA